MTEEEIELNLKQLRIALQQAADPAERQIELLGHWDASFQVADDFCNCVRWALGCSELKLTGDQHGCLESLDDKFDVMSGRAALWTDGALRFNPEWDEVRRRARKALELFHWPVNGRLRGVWEERLYTVVLDPEP